MEKFLEVFQQLTLFDIIYLIITVYFVIKCLKDGFVLSILSFSKWIIAYILTIIIFPRVKPYFKNTLDSEYVLDILLGVSLFVIVIFIILLINKAIRRVVTYSGLGTMDRIFGFFFGFFKAYIICVCIFATANIVYNHKKWPINLGQSLTYPWVEKGSNYLIKGLPNEKEYEDAKDKVQSL